MELYSFGAGFLVALIFSSIMIVIASELRKKRALAFTRRFAVISEGLSSLKALAFRISGQLRRLRHHYQGKDLSKKDIQRFRQCLEGLTYIFETISAGMMPPTEEIAMEALEGRRSSAEQKAYEDGLKFRDDVRRLRQILDNQGIEGIGKQSSSSGSRQAIITQETEEDTFYRL